MKFIITILLVTLLACKKDVKLKEVYSNVYLIKYNYNHSYFDPLAMYPGTYDRIIHSEQFDTIVEIEVNTTNLKNDVVRFNGLIKFQNGTEFTENIINPILNEENKLVISDYYINDTMNGFLKDDSIYYHFSIEKGIYYNCLIEGVKIK